MITLDKSAYACYNYHTPRWEAIFTMLREKYPKNGLVKAVFAVFLVFMSIFSMTLPSVVSDSVYAEPEEEMVEETAEETKPVDGEAAGETTSETEGSSTRGETSTDGASCKDSLGAIGWLVCPVTGVISKAVDTMYDLIRDILVINPVELKDGQPIYEMWKYFRAITNVVFIIFLLIVIYSQITGFGINNYGIKKALPKLIVMAILVNLSFVICSIAVDASNIIGNGLRSVFENVEQTSIATMNWDRASYGIKMAEMYEALAGGIAIGGIAIAFSPGSIFMLIPVALGAIVAVVSGLITIALRQAIVVLLIMVAPLAMVANILPNTESLFNKWKSLLIKMLTFYPMFSVLFGASHLAGFAIITSAKDGFGLILGIAVQIFPLFFSWKMMEMSGTILGTINSKIRGLAAKPIVAGRGWAESRKNMMNAERLQYGTDSASHLRRYLDNRKALREHTTQSLQAMRKNDANTYVQRMIAAGYDGMKAKGTEGDYKASKYTHIAKDLSTSELVSKTVEMDTKHAIGNYGDYYVSKKLRDGKKFDRFRPGVSDEALRIARENDQEYVRNSQSAKMFIELSRAQMTAENDEEADFNFMARSFIKADNNRDADPEKYAHLIGSSAGGLGEVGQTRVLGKIIARSASVESNQRRDINILANKYPPLKSVFRSMIVGYLVDDDGYAVDREGNRLETVRGYLKDNAPDQLVLWDQVDDELGPYFDWYDDDGNYVTRIYKNDGSAFKELFSNFDAPINDPINNLYAMLSGVKEDSSNPYLAHVGLSKYKTTIGRALGSFKEKNAAFSPMVSEMIKKGYVGNYAELNLAYLDSLNKATKPGAFNIQDSDAIRMMTHLMDPDLWSVMFPVELLRERKNVNGEEIYGIRINPDGTETKVNADEMTQEELMNRIKKKYIFPAAHKMLFMMSRQTPNTADNQKAGTIKDWKELVDMFVEKWGEGGLVDEDPFMQSGDMRTIVRNVQRGLYTIDENGNRQQYSGGGKSGRGGNGGSSGGRADDGRLHRVRKNHHVVMDEIYGDCNGDVEEFVRKFDDYCDSEPELERAKNDFHNEIDGQMPGITAEEAYRIAYTTMDEFML